MKCLALVRKDNINRVEEKELNMELLRNPDIPWVHFSVKGREAFKNVESNELFTEALLDRLQNPGSSFLVERIGNVRVLDCNVNYEFVDSNEQQLTLIFFPNKAVTISTIGQILTDDIQPEDVIDSDRKYDANLVILTLFRRILDRNTSLANKLIKRVDVLLKSSIARSFETTPDELEKLHSGAIDLNELFEDQLTTIRLLPMNIDEHNVAMIGFLDRVEKSMEYLVKVTERSQDKLDYILQRYANVLQQKGNARLNTLTIVQAIFVPLTFLAGIYGMNFVNMPELETQSGYFYLLGIMVLLGLGGLYLFYRNGWFNSK